MAVCCFGSLVGRIPTVCDIGPTCIRGSVCFALAYHLFHLEQVEHTNRMVLGDVVLAFGDLSLAGASDEAIVNFISEQSTKHIRGKKPKSGKDGAVSAVAELKDRSDDSDDDDDDDDDAEDSDDSDPFGDGDMLTVIVMRSIAVHVSALQTRISVALDNYSMLMTQGSTT